MSYSLALTPEGDLDVQGDHLRLVFGINKLKQDLNAWLRERWGGDRFHVNYGSILQEFIGSVVGDHTQAEVNFEVLRVLQNYQDVQQRALRETPSLLSQSELLVAIGDISTKVDYDTVRVAVKVLNGTDDAATVTASTTT